MSQQINLLNPSLIKQKDFFNPTTIVITLGILLALMLGYYSYVQKQLLLLTAQRSQIALLEQIAQLEQKQAMQQQILQTVNQSSATPEKGYAALMRAFAKQSLDGLWLTSFTIDSQSEQLNISGRTLQGDLVPEYISRLGNEPALKGKLFAALNMSLPKTKGSANATPTVTLQPVNSTNLTASIIKSGISAMPASTPAPPAEVQNNEVNYIEFSLHSTDDKSAALATETKVGGQL